MQHSSLTSVDASRKQLSQLTLIRSILLGMLWISFLLTLEIEHIKVSFTQLLNVLLMFSTIHVLTLFRLKNKLPVEELECLIHLLIDIGCLSVLFYFSGGANNPFISYLLFPICISAATLPWRYTWLVTISCLVSYATLLFFYIPLPIFEVNHQHSDINWHILGMWFNFSISAILITYFVVKMASTLQEQNKELAVMREDELRNQQLMAVAMLAAGAAHEMNTPLSTMTVLLSEMESEHKNNQHIIADLSILKSQVKTCAATLKQLVKDANEANEGKLKQQNVKSFCDSIINRWQLMRPNVNFLLNRNQIDGSISHDPRLDQAIINLLNNAADASPHQIQIHIFREANQLVWQIIDAGEGINHKITNKLGKIMLSTKEKGLGIGMLLAHATIKSYSGSITQTSNTDFGTTTTFKLPLLI